MPQLFGPRLASSPDQLQAPQESDPFAQVEQFLSTLQTAPIPQAQKAKVWQNVVGSLGDAILSMARVRAGGGPGEGPFAQSLRARQSQIASQQQAAEEANRQLENEVRITAYKEQLMRGRPEKARKFRPQMKVFSAKDETGRPVDIPYVFDPDTQTLNVVQGFEQGFHKYIRPFLAQGVNTETGELEYHLVDPLLGMRQLGGDTGGAAPGAPPGATPTPGVTRVPGIEPKPTAGEAESAEAATVIQEQLTRFNELAAQYSGRERLLGTARSLGQGVVRAVPGGQVMTETFGDPDFEELTALRDRIGQQLARLVESGRLSDQDREFALRNLPTAPALTTETGRKTAAAKIALVQKEIATRLARKRRLRPGLMGGAEAPAPTTESPSTPLTVDELLKRYEEEFGAPSP